MRLLLGAARPICQQLAFSVAASGFAARQRRAYIDAQNPIRLSDLDYPQPDVMLLRYVPGMNRRRTITPADVLLLIEVSDASIQHDRPVKLPRYAAGIPEVRIVDLNGGRVETYLHPAAGRYIESAVHEDDQLVSPSAFPDITIPAKELLP